jgi:HK97 family phage prohead protease
MSRPPWLLGADDGYDLSSRAAIRQSERQVIATRDLVARDPTAGFVRIRAGISRLDPTHAIVQGNPDAWRLGPARGRAGRYEQRSGGSFAVGPPRAPNAAPDEMSGHFAVFNVWTEINNFFEGRFLERVAPGAFTATFARGGQRVLLEHGHDPQVGNKPIAKVDPLSLSEDGKGAAYRVALLDGVPELVVSGLAAGTYGASFRFRARREELVSEPPVSAHNPEGIAERTLLEVDVAEFGPVTFGAYPDATAGLAA